ncbi:MAG: amino acid ABC transporter permease [Anaerolineales bacterium]|nr:amino acid ABC transporter permease [Anaerolineales bacterium]
MEKKTKAQAATAQKTVLAAPGEELGAHMDPWWGLVIAVAALAAFLIFTYPDPYGRIFRYVSDGVAITFLTTVLSFLMVVVVGLVGGLGRISKHPVIYGLSTLYVEIVRGIPLLVQLIFWYYAFPALVQSIGDAYTGTWLAFLSDFRAPALPMAIFGLTICYGAYMSEIYRAGIQSIPKGQIEAARSLGMSYAQTMRYVVLPQAVRVILPPMGNEFVSLLKDSSLVSVVAVADMTRRGQEFMSVNFIPLETWAMIALLYLMMTLFSARIVTWIEKRSKFER